jgi:hypothetical protein
VTLGGTTRQAVYIGGTGTRTLLFSVQPAVGDAGAVQVGSALVLNGGGIRDHVGNSLANLGLPVANTQGVLVEATPPWIASVQMPGSVAGYRAGEWVTMKVTALNAVNEIASNFTAAFMTVRDFIATMFNSEGALAHLMNTMFSTAANYMKEQLYGALASFMEAIGRMGMAEAFRIEAETARNVIEMNAKGMGAQFELVGEQAAAAGRAMPENFEKNKASLQPIFDLTPVLQEQQQLHASIEQKLALEKTSTEAINSAGAGYAASLGIANAALESSGPLSSQIALNLTDASNAAAGIAPAFDLAAGSSAQIPLNLESTSTYAEASSQWLKEGEKASEQVSIHGSTLPGNARAFASAISEAKIDAQISANIFAGLSDRMQAAVNRTSDMIDKMREAFHFGVMSEKDRVRMRDLEEKRYLAEKAKERAMDAAERRERAGQDRSAYEMRRRAEAAYTRKLEKLMPDLVKATDDARKSLEKGGKEGGDAVKKLSDEAGKLIKTGGESAGKALEKAADALKGKPEDKRQDLALEATLKKCMEFLRNIDRNLPQNALS